MNIDAIYIHRPIRACPVLPGIPHDSEPHFSPSGDRLIFKSEAELGVENIWVMEWKGCEQMDVRAKETSSEDLRVALGQQAVEEKLLAQGVAEEPHKKTNRLIREGCSHGKTKFEYAMSLLISREAQRITNETFRWFSEARFHPSGTKVIATKRVAPPSPSLLPCTTSVHHHHLRIHLHLSATSIYQHRST